MRHAKAKGRYKIYHIPLDLNVNTLLRGVDRWDSVGHLHLFTIETAIKSVEQANQKVLALLSHGWRSRSPRELEVPRWPIFCEGPFAA